MSVDVTAPAPQPMPSGTTTTRPSAPPPRLVVEQWAPDSRGRAQRHAVRIGLVLLVLFVTSLVPDVYTNLVSKAAVFAIVALSMNILVGYAGQVSLGHAAFFGAGAFAAGYTLTELDLPWGAGLVVAALSGAFAAVLLGAVALRVKGLYLAIVTISYGLFAQEVVFNITSLTGGGAGQVAPRPVMPGFIVSFMDGLGGPFSAMAGGLDGFTSDLSYAYLCIAFLAVFLLFDTLFAGSKAGRAVRALRESERVAASWGINVTGYKLLAFVLSGLIAAVAGGLFASIEQRVAPADFQFLLSITFLLMAVVGGVGNRWGVVQGGVLFAVLPTLLERSHENLHFWPFTAIDITLEPVISAALLILTLTLYPGGIAQQQHHLHSWLRMGKFKDDTADPLTDPPAVYREDPLADPEGARL
ncbi:branched-chain amino acid ABC transporter permease [Euzebya pacifica]|jgi:branched-chain amino acid transport system permease protein|uniref:branched-chain amino acid ABC transporter permease n=1 Tax=Euzebya pacifica TaxID=1608957 RepID=UPI0030F5A849